MLGLLINILHLLLVIFIVWAPFSSNKVLILLHLVIVPFIMLHWLTNQSVCALTELEKLVTGNTCDDQTFFGKIVGPVYKFNTQKDENVFVWIVMIVLWVISFVNFRNIKP